VSAFALRGNTRLQRQEISCHLNPSTGEPPRRNVPLQIEREPAEATCSLSGRPGKLKMICPSRQLGCAAAARKRTTTVIVHAAG
jgi:hypothetical protein